MVLITKLSLIFSFHIFFDIKNCIFVLPLFDCTMVGKGWFKWIIWMIVGKSVNVILTSFIRDAVRFSNPGGGWASSNVVGIICPLPPCWCKVNWISKFKDKLQIWTGHSTLISENLKPVEISKNHFKNSLNIFKSCIHFQN